MEHEEKEMEGKRRSFLRERCQNSRGGGVVSGQGGRCESESTERDDREGKKDHKNWSDTFVPRSSSEQTRNCAHVDRDLQKYIINILTTELLKTENWIEISLSERGGGDDVSGITRCSSRGSSPKQHLSCNSGAITSDSSSNASHTTHLTRNYDDNPTTTHQQEIEKPLNSREKESTSSLATESDEVIINSSSLHCKINDVMTHWNLGGNFITSDNRDCQIVSLCIITHYTL